MRPAITVSTITPTPNGANVTTNGGMADVTVSGTTDSVDFDDVDTSKAAVNNNPRYPDRYYKKKGLTNPYLNADKWVPNQ